MTAPSNTSRRSIRRHLLTGALVAGALIASVAGWAGTAKLAGAVIANGVVVVDSEVKKVQHPTGGIIGELRVRNDQRVNAGDVVVRLDETQTKANLAVFTKSLDELSARQARSKPRRMGLSPFVFRLNYSLAKPMIPRSLTFLMANASCSVFVQKRETGRSRNCESAWRNSRSRSAV